MMSWTVGAVPQGGSDAGVCQGQRLLYRRLGVPPTGSVLIEACRLTEPELARAAKTVGFADPLPLAESHFIAQELTRDVRFQALKLALRDSVEPLGRGDLDSIERTLSQALQVGRTQQDGGELWYVTQIAERLTFSAQEAFFSLLMPPLDAVVKVAKQDLVVGLAQPNTGKTFFLLWIALAAFVQRQKTVFYTLEMLPVTLARRLNSVIAKLETADLVRYRSRVLSRVQRIGRLYGDSIVFKALPMKGADVFDIRQHLQSLIARGFTPDVVCLDYADLLRQAPVAGRRGFESGRSFEIGDIYAGLKALNQEFDLTTFTVSQARRAGAGSAASRSRRRGARSRRPGSADPGGRDLELGKSRDRRHRLALQPDAAGEAPAAAAHPRGQAAPRGGRAGGADPDQSSPRAPSSGTWRRRAVGVDWFSGLIWGLAITWALLCFLGLGGIELLQAIWRWAQRLWTRARQWWRG